MSRAGGTRYESVYEDRDRDYHRGGGGARPRYNDVDVEVRTRDDYDRRPRQPEFLREDYGRTDAGPVVLARDGDRRKPARDYEEEEILIRTKSRDKPRDPPTAYRDDYVDVRETESVRRPSERRREEVDIDIRENDTRSRGTRRGGRDEVDIDIRENDTRSRTTRRDHEHDDVDINIRSTSRPARPKRTNTEDIVFRRGEGERRRPAESVVDREEVRIKRDEWVPPRHRDGSSERIHIDINETHSDHAPPRARSNYGGGEREDIDIRIREREDDRRSRRGDVTDNTLVVRERSQSKPRQRIASEREDYYFHRRSPSPPPRNDQEEIIIRRKLRTPSPSPVRAPSPPTPEPVPELPPIMRPPIHQEVITHHRHIDHGMVRAPSSSSSPSPPPKRREPRHEDLDIEIRRRDGRGGVEDIHIHDRDDDKRSRKAPTRASSSSVEKIETRSRRARSELGSRSRVRSGSRNQEKRERENLELSLQINNNANNDRQMIPRPPQPPAPPQRPKDMWTEITKDLVSREAIEYMGYQYEETPEFFYVMDYMRYEDVTRLVEISEHLHRDRRERIGQIQWERQDPRLGRPRSPHGDRRAIDGPRRDIDGGRRDYDERIYEREVIYEDGTRKRYRVPG